MSAPKILVYDIETSPMLAYIWSMWNEVNNINQIAKDWHIMAWAAKWLDDPASKIMYMDQRKVPNIEDDSKIVKALWKLIESADAVVTHNGKSFDEKKVNARFLAHGLPPSKVVKHIDTYLIAKKNFGFTSNKLEYLAGKFCTKHKKYTHPKFSGIELWKECIHGNTEAWREMEKYNKQDVLALEELYYKLRPWDSGTNFSVFGLTCSCGSTELKKNGVMYTNSASYQRYRCAKCGHETRDTKSIARVNKANIGR